MAVVTPSNVNRVNLGSANLVIADFTTVSDGDTWASGMASIMSKWIDDNSNPATQASVGVASTFSGGTFTFFPAEDGTPCTLHVIIE